MLEIWTDGSCVPNPGPGGWGWCRSDGATAFGSSVMTTSNQMELTAILEALRALPNGAVVKIWSDSQYSVNGLTLWRAAWKKKNWMRGQPWAPVPRINRDLWLALEAQIARVNVTFGWVRGHNGNAGNEEADRLADLGLQQATSAEPQYDPADEFLARIRSMK